MAKIQSNFSKYLILLVISVNFCEVEPKASVSFDFEGIKSSLFSLNPFSDFGLFSLSPKDLQCFKELNEIKNGLQNTEQWAMKRKFKMKKRRKISSHVENTNFLKQLSMPGVKFRPLQ